MVMSKFVVEWNGWVGQPGFSTFFVSGNTDDTQTNAAAAAIKTMIGLWASYIPQVITLAFHPTVQVVNDGDGSLVEERPISTKPSDTLGASGLAFSAVSGFCITWRTAARGPRKPTLGRSYVVPATGAAFHTDGTMLDTARTALLANSNTYVNRVAAGVPGHPVVWRRNTPGGTNGQSFPITSATINDRAVFLSSRRV
jgi:hypothetical protein